MPGCPPLPGPRHPGVDGPGRDPGPEHRSGARRAVGPPGAVAAAIGPRRPPGRPGCAGGARGAAGPSRLVAADGRRLRFADDLPATTGGAQARMERLLRSIDGYLARRGGEGAQARPSARAVHGGSRPGRARRLARHRHRDLGDRLPARPTLARLPVPGPARRDRPPPRRDQRPRPLRARPEIPAPPQFHLRRRRRKRRPVRGRPH